MFSWMLSEEFLFLFLYPFVFLREGGGVSIMFVVRVIIFFNKVNFLGFIIKPSFKT